MKMIEIVIMNSVKNKTSKFCYVPYTNMDSISNDDTYMPTTMGEIFFVSMFCPVTYIGYKHNNVLHPLFDISASERDKVVNKTGSEVFVIFHLGEYTTPMSRIDKWCEKNDYISTHNFLNILEKLEEVFFDSRYSMLPKSYREILPTIDMTYYGMIYEASCNYLELLKGESFELPLEVGDDDRAYLNKLMRDMYYNYNPCIFGINISAPEEFTDEMYMDDFGVVLDSIKSLRDLVVNMVRLSNHPISLFPKEISDSVIQVISNCRCRMIDLLLTFLIAYKEQVILSKDASIFDKIINPTSMFHNIKTASNRVRNLPL